MRWRAFSLVLCGAVILTGAPPRTRAADVEARTKIIGQVRPSYYDGSTEAPFWLYGDLGINRLRHGINGEGYFSLDENFGPNTGGGDFYTGVVRIPNAVTGLDMSLGRQFLSEGPRGSNNADSGRITYDASHAGVPVAVTVFGGQPTYFEPTYGSPSISQDEQMFGGRIMARGLTDTYANVGYLQYIRDGNVLSQDVLTNIGHTFRGLPGQPMTYGYFSYDAGNNNIDMVRGGMSIFLLPPRLYYNVESTYYDPSRTGKHILANPNLRVDPLFDVFSVSDEFQAKNSLRYVFTKAFAVFANLGYQRYQNTQYDQTLQTAAHGVYTNGYLSGAGLHWLPGGDGLESVRLEYYGANSRGGNLNGGRFYYDNWVYERIYFHAKVDVGYYEKITNQSGTVVATLLGLGYDVAPGLYCETYMEANHSPRFDADIRFGLNVVYNWAHRFKQHAAPPTNNGAIGTVPGASGTSGGA